MLRNKSFISGWRSWPPENANCSPLARIEQRQGCKERREERYRRLSIFSIHAIPDSMPQAHNPHGQALTFPVFQAAGFLLALNAIAIPVGFFALYASILLAMKDETREVFRDVARVLIESVAGVTVTVQGRPWYKLS
jgi:hypothetical protein